MVEFVDFIVCFTFNNVVVLVLRKFHCVANEMNHGVLFVCFGRKVLSIRLKMLSNAF